MNTKLQEYIVKIAETGSITKAAAALFITQSALDQQLLKLEAELGVRLFRRAKNSFALTEAGEVYVAYARKMIAEKNEAYAIISDLAERSTGLLSIGLTPERGIGMFMAVYPYFYKTYPAIKVIPREISVFQQLEMIREETLDIGFITISGSMLPQTGLEYRAIMQEQLVLAIPKTHAMAGKASPPGMPRTVIDLNLFRDDAFVLIFKESTQRALIDPVFAASGFQPNVILETASNHTMISMVEKGLSCAVVPDYYAQPSDKIAYFDLAGDLTWQLVACYKKTKYLSKAADCFIGLATTYWQNRQAQRLKKKGLPISAIQDV